MWVRRRWLRGAGIPDGIKLDRIFLMDMKELSSDTLRTAVNKKPYEKPSFRHEKVFVTTALSCGKINVTQGSCAANLSAS